MKKKLKINSLHLTDENFEKLNNLKKPIKNFRVQEIPSSDPRDDEEE